MRDDGLSLKKVQTLNWLLLAAMSLAGLLFFSGQVAKSIFIGGLIVTVSFRFLQRDLTKLLTGPLTAVKGRFFIKYYARFAVVAVVLFYLIHNRAVDTTAMLVGLSTVLVSIIVTTAGEAKKIYLSTKEAS
ncbi:MAG: ATP synthase subunit I [Desulfobulbaceae bacterium]|nr:ATP synthase subunit I [Desulfobulbaceae bacterium]